MGDLPLPAELEHYATDIKAAGKNFVALVTFAEPDKKGKKAQGKPLGPEAPMGGTRTLSVADIPADASWRQWGEEVNERHNGWMDGDCFAFQLNLGDIPEDFRPYHVPKQGVVWVFTNLENSWETTVHFDARPANEIPWLPRPTRREYIGQYETAMRTVFVPKAMWATCGPSYPDFSAGVVESPAWLDWTDHMHLSHWLNMQPFSFGAGPGQLQVGGWFWPVQGDFSERNKTIVAGMYQMHFGDSGSIELHYDSDASRWFAIVESH